MARNRAKHYQQRRAPNNGMQALRLARFFDMSPQFWLGLQMDYDLDVKVYL
jgi:plasmid maintenance system antidote protein VapI